MDDITTRLLRNVADRIGTDDEQHYFDCHEAAAEIERLRRWGRLTDAEREEVRRARDQLLSGTVGYHNEFAADNRRRAGVLDGILERLGHRTADEAARLPLTDAEREAVERNLKHANGKWLMHVSERDQAVIGGLLERTEVER